MDYLEDLVCVIQGLRTDLQTRWERDCDREEENKALRETIHRLSTEHQDLVMAHMEMGTNMKILMERHEQMTLLQDMSECVRLMGVQQELLSAHLGLGKPDTQEAIERDGNGIPIRLPSPFLL